MCLFDSNDSVLLFSENKYDDDDVCDVKYCNKHVGVPLPHFKTICPNFPKFFVHAKCAVIRSSSDATAMSCDPSFVADVIFHILGQSSWHWQY